MIGKIYPGKNCHILMRDGWNLSPVTEVWKNQDGAELLSSSCNPLHECELLIIACLGASLIYATKFLAYVSYLQKENTFTLFFGPLPST